MKALSVPILFTVWAVAVLAQQQERKNPFTSPDDVAAGGRIFRSHCAECHGLDGTGGRGTNLTSGQFRHGSSDEALYDTIANGIPGTEMPGIFFDGRQLWQLVAFVRSLGWQAEQAQLKGDPSRGEALFRGKGGCLQCHMIHGQGARLGPDLSDVGAKRSPEHLRSSVLRPNEKVLPSHWTVRVVTRDGKRISGTRLNEDTHSLQILDSNENLVSLLKADLQEHQLDKTSPMPPYEGTFSENELNDLIAYLATLRRKGPPR